jgi:hypothetical protein
MFSVAKQGNEDSRKISKNIIHSCLKTLIQTFSRAPVCKFNYLRVETMKISTENTQHTSNWFLCRAALGALDRRLRLFEVAHIHSRSLFVMKNSNPPIHQFDDKIY